MWHAYSFNAIFFISYPHIYFTLNVEQIFITRNSSSIKSQSLVTNVSSFEFHFQLIRRYVFYIVIAIVSRRFSYFIFRIELPFIIAEYSVECCAIHDLIIGMSGMKVGNYLCNQRYKNVAKENKDSMRTKLCNNDMLT